MQSKQFTARSLAALSALVFLTTAVFTQAADPEIFATKNGAIRGYDTVAYFSLQPGDKAVKGSEEFTHEYKGATWRFASAENRDLFAADPEKYAPQYGGYCAFAVSHDFTKSISPNVWKIVDGKLYLNFNRIAYRKWDKNLDESIVRGDKNWPTVLTSCEEHNNCRS